MFKSTPIRKRNRIIRRILGIGIVCLVVLVFVGGVAYYFISQQLKKPLYISPVSSLKVVENNEEDTASILKKRLKEKHIEFDSMSSSGSAYFVNLKEGGEVTFSSEKNIAEQVSSLQFILSRLTMEGKLFSRLDLRFEKPVVVLR